MKAVGTAQKFGVLSTFNPCPLHTKRIDKTSRMGLI
jgi:hypothetical protein